MQQQSDGILVVGAGISGIRSALDLAETGRHVILVDRATHIGGVLSHLDNQFPNDHCGMCRLLPSLDRDAGSQFCLRKGFYHDNIEIHTATELSDLSGEAGKFAVRLRRKTQRVDVELCSGCGLCESVCPVAVPDPFNGGLGLRKAIHRPVPHAVPQPYVIDDAVCTRCGLCEDVCPTQAIRLAGDGRSGFRILVVDDEFAVRDSLREWMLNEGFASVDLAASGPEALEILDRQSFQLMLVDVKMPGMDGVELLKQARDRYPELTVIMMTAHATVETAVEAMKYGAMDYFMKPFDPQVMIPLVVQTYDKYQAGHDIERTVGAVILATGTDYFDPAVGINPYGLGKTPHVVTNLQFERMLSAAGPTAGRLVRPATGDADAKPISKIAWMQCVGSRDIQSQADFCSTMCCMASIKEALLAKEKSASRIDTVIYHMDMRTAGKSFQRYRDRAADRDGVRFERARVHSIRSDLQTGDPVIRAMGLDGSLKEEAVDLVVLAVGQRPSPGTAELAEIAQLQLNPWGFLESSAFHPARSSRSGIFLSGGTSGLKGIGESVIQASAAALEAGFIDGDGGDDHPAAGKMPIPASESLSQDLPAVMAMICTCQGRLESVLSRDRLRSHLMRDPAVSGVAFIESLCTDSGWQQIQALITQGHANRLLIGACHPLRFAARRTELARTIGLPTRLMAAVDLKICDLPAPDKRQAAAPCEPQGPESGLAALEMGLATLKHADPDTLPGIPVARRALVVGGGIAGMQAALGMAQRGVEVDLVEETSRLGGNLQWLQHTLDGGEVAPFLAETVAAVERQPLIQCRLNSRVVDISGQAGDFHSTVQIRDETAAASELPAAETVSHLSHGVVVLATGGKEAATDQYGYGSHGAVVTQKEVEERLASGDLDARALDTVVMIQCVGSRRPGRNFCSRICCPTALKHALALKKENPDMAVYIIYRDMMTSGFVETYYTQARRAGVIFIQYRPDRQPRVDAEQEQVKVSVHDPILDLPLEINPDLLVLAVGISPTPARQLEEAMGIAGDEDGFFQEADAKWRPVESIREGIFACGLSLAPGTIAEAVLSGQAAAQRAMRILVRSSLPAGSISASVRPSLCALCRRCIDTCPFSARWIDEVEQRVVVNPAMCQGCGACAAVCPNGAAVLAGFGKHQVLDMIDAALTA